MDPVYSRNFGFFVFELMYYSIGFVCTFFKSLLELNKYDFDTDNEFIKNCTKSNCIR